MNMSNFLGVTVKHILQLVCMLAFTGAAVALLLSYLAMNFEYLELISHFRVQFLSLIISSGLILSLFHSWRWSVPTLLFSLLCAWPVIPYYWPCAQTQPHGPVIKLLNSNVLISNGHYQELGELIQQQAPDMVTLEEIDADWVAKIAPYLRQYPYRVVVPMNNAFGIALYSKLPLQDNRVAYFGDVYKNQHFPSIVAKVLVATNTFTILVTHPLPPLAGFAVRNSQLADIAAHRTVFGKDLLMVGDLNLSPWSPYFSRLLKQTGLRDSQLGFGVQPSWPSDKPLVKIPIDHVLVSDRFVILNRQLGPSIHSDHLPVIVEFALKQ